MKKDILIAAAIAGAALAILFAYGAFAVSIRAAPGIWVWLSAPGWGGRSNLITLILLGAFASVGITYVVRAPK